MSVATVHGARCVGRASLNGFLFGRFPKFQTMFEPHFWLAINFLLTFDFKGFSSSAESAKPILLDR